MATYINTKDTIGEQATLDALVAHTLTDFTDGDSQNSVNMHLTVRARSKI